jgi:hypothetical protein
MVLFTVPEQEPNATAADSTHAELKKFEQTLKTDVDADFFLEPSEFKTLTRVIDILGAQLLESDALSSNHYYSTGKHSSTITSSSTNIPSDQVHKNNPAYNALKKQQGIVEKAIEHLTLNHYADLNASVVAVGKVSQRFGDAVGQVQGLKMQVQEMREHLTQASSVGIHRGSNDFYEKEEMMDTHHHNQNGKHHQSTSSSSSRSTNDHHPTTTTMVPSTASGVLGDKSLRELWLKKLECEAVLALIQKLELIRDTPGVFDLLVHSHPCRIGTAVVTLMNALNTMFEEDITQIQGLNQITEQLMIRRQKAEEIVWETLQDVIFLRTGNFPKDKNRTTDGNSTHRLHSSNGSFHGGDSVAERRRKAVATATISGNSSKLTRKGTHPSSSSITGSKSGNHNMSTDQSSDPHHRNKQHLFVSIYNQYDEDSDNELEEASIDYYHEDFSIQSGVMTESSHYNKNSSSGHFFPSGTQELVSSNLQQVGQLLPKNLMDSELHLEVDELRCLENWSNNFSFQSQNATYSTFSSDSSLVLPRYTDPILGLRILVESLAKLKRLDDVERVVSENLERELKKISQMEQAKTLGKLEKKRNTIGPSAQHRLSTGMNIDAAEEKLRDFQSHLNSLLTAFGSVLIRLTFLAQILRHRIVSDFEFLLFF